MNTSDGRNHESRFPYGGSEKKVPGELHYYSRSEPPHPEVGHNRKKKRGGIFRNNPSLLLILIDIIVVVLVLVFLLPFLRPKASEDDFFGYSFSLHGYIYESTVHARIIVQPSAAPSGGGNDLQDRIDTGFILNLRIRDSSLEEDFEFLPRQVREDTIIYRTEFEIEDAKNENEIKLLCRVFHGGKSVSLQKTLRN